MGVRQRAGGGRRLATCSVMALVFVLGFPSVALGQPPSLSDTRLLGALTAVTYSCEPGSMAGTVTFSAEGQAAPFSDPSNGPASGGYTGTFTESGSIRYGPTGNGLRFQSTFTITTAGPNPTRVTGSKTRELSDSGGCTPGFIDVRVTGATFDAVITEPSGLRYRDSGRSEVHRIFRDTRAGANGNQFHETYAESLPAPVPLLTAPAFTADSPPATAVSGTAFGPYTFTAIGLPAPTFTHTGNLPPGLTLNPTTGVLSGTPTTPGAFSFTVRAANGVGPAATSRPLTITVAAATRDGYWLVASDGGIFAFGDARFHGSTGGTQLDKPVVGIAPIPSGNGYWLVASDGGIFAYGDATFAGSTGGTPLDQPVVGMAATPSGKGYWLVASDGGIFAYGDATFAGSTGGTPLDQPVVGMAPTPTGNGYWLVASDGGIFAYGDATFAGSTGGIVLSQPVVGMAPTPTGNGYWLVASDGGIFTFGDATFRGSTHGTPIATPIVAMAATGSGKGYWLVSSEGGIFAFPDARFHGSTGALLLENPIVGMARIL